MFEMSTVLHIGHSPKILHLPLTLATFMSCSCWSRKIGWKNVYTKSEWAISSAESKSETKNNRISGKRRSATVCTFDRPTWMPVDKLLEIKTFCIRHNSFQFFSLSRQWIKFINFGFYFYLWSLASGKCRQSFWWNSKNSLYERNRKAGSGWFCRVTFNMYV